MCDFGIGTALASAFGAGGATAAGAGAAAATTGIGSTLQTVGLIASIGGSIAQGIAVNNAAQEQAAFLERQAETEAYLTSIEDERTRERFKSEIAKQTAELASRGVDLGSPAAVMLGETAAREMSFASQEVRSRGAARGEELSASARAAKARGRLGLLKGGLSAASTFFEDAPEIWPGLKGEGAPA